MSSTYKKSRNLSMSNTTLGQSLPTFQTLPGTPSFSTRSLMDSHFNFLGSVKSLPTQAVPLTPQQQLIQSSLQVRSAQYQSLLIVQKELELQLLEEQSRARSYQQILKRKSAPLSDIQRRIAQGYELIEKKREYAASLELHVKERLEKLEQQRWQEVTNLEVKLEKEYQNLERKLNEESRSFVEILKEKQKELEFAVELKLQCEKDVGKIVAEREARIRKNSEVRKEMDRKRKEFQIVSAEYREIQAELAELQKEEKQLQIANTRLRELTTIQEEHNKACMVIERAIIMKQQQKVKLEAYNRETSKEYQTNLIPHLKQMIKEKSKQNDVLSKKLEEKNRFIVELSDRYQKRKNELTELQIKFRRTLSAN